MNRPLKLPADLRPQNPQNWQEKEKHLSPLVKSLARRLGVESAGPRPRAAPRYPVSRSSASASHAALTRSAAGALPLSLSQGSAGMGGGTGTGTGMGGGTAAVSSGKVRRLSQLSQLRYGGSSEQRQGAARRTSTR